MRLAYLHEVWRNYFPEHQTIIVLQQTNTYKYFAEGQYEKVWLWCDSLVSSAFVVLKSSSSNTTTVLNQSSWWLRWRSSSPLPRAVNMLNFKIEDCYGNKTWSKKGLRNPQGNLTVVKRDNKQTTGNTPSLKPHIHKKGDWHQIKTDAIIRHPWGLIKCSYSNLAATRSWVPSKPLSIWHHDGGFSFLTLQI